MIESGIESLRVLVDNALKDGGALLPNLSADQISALYTLAYYLYENGKYADSNQVFRFLTICEPFSSRYWMGLGASYQVMKEYAAALECYSVAAVQNPENPYVHLHAADCFFGIGDTENAIHTLESAIAAADASKESLLLNQLKQMHQAWSCGCSKAFAGE